MSKIKLPPAVSPICLSTSVSLTAGNTAVGNMADLTSPLRSPMIIDEISFMVKHTETNSATVIDYPGGSIRVKLRTSRFDLTNNYVPIWNFGPVIDETMDSASGWASPQNSVTTSGKDDSLQHFLWKLPKPLFLRPGDMIFPEFQRQSDGVAGTSKVYITYHGRLMPIDCPIPPEVWIPYVSAWIPTLANGQTYYVSNKDHFFNKLQVPLHVQRFIQRIQRTNSGQSRELFDQPMYGLDAPQAAPLSVKITDSKGYQVCGDFVPSSCVFNINRRALTVKTVIDPNEMFIVEYANVPSTTVQPMLSMIGARKEAA
jgi:hypothetical protein